MAGPIRKRFLLDTGDIWILFGFVFLLSGASFTVGILFGYGLSPEGRHSGDASEKISLKEDAEELIEAKTESGEEREGAADESSSLEKDFSNSKQNALNVAALDESLGVSPKSIADARAFMDGDENARKPASVDDVSSEEALVQEKIKTAKKEEAARTAKGVPHSVSTLFERKPSSIEKFSPVSGTFTLNVGSYATSEEAQAKRNQLYHAGFADSYTQVIESKSGERWYRVSFGSYPSAEWAHKTGEKLLKRKLVNDYIVKEYK